MSLTPSNMIQKTKYVFAVNIHLFFIFKLVLNSE